MVTAPLDTEKLSELKEAIPLFDVVASSPLTVKVCPEATVSIPSPEAIVNVCESKSIEPDPLAPAKSKS